MVLDTTVTIALEIGAKPFSAFVPSRWADENVSRTRNTRQQSGCKNDRTAYARESTASAEVSERRLQITAGSTWEFKDKVKNMYQVEHDEPFAGIR